MNGKLMYNTSNNNVAKKKTAVMRNVTLHFKDESEIINPTVYISRDVTDVEYCNYLYIDELGRYYYVNEITLEHQRYILQCHVDVLMSHYDKILEQRCLIERNGSIGNLYLEDNKMKTFAMTRFETFPWLDSSGNPKGFRVGGSKVKNFVLTVSGSGQPEPEPENNNQGGVE